MRHVQVEAADPDVSAFVSANAGSGKTYVLAQRVINLLLRGVDPAKILCITFTKTAAANMANEVFKRLAGWTALNDAALDSEIALSTGGKPGAEQRARARRLFASALETPGGLKVQTIHAFCTRLLHQFPFEANVAARFTVLDEASTTQLLDQLTLGRAAGSLRQAGRRARPGAGDRHRRVAADQTFKDVIGDAIRERDAIEAWIQRAGSVDKAIGGIVAGPRRRSQRHAGIGRAGILFRSLIPAAEWPALIEILDAGSKSDHNHIAALEAARSRDRPRAHRQLSQSVLHRRTRRRAKISSPRRSPTNIPIGWRACSPNKTASARCSRANARWPPATAPARWSPSRPT